MIYPDIETLIPHRPPARMIEAVLDRVENLITCSGRISRSHPLAEGRWAPASLGLEMGAQAAAALAVLLARDSDPTFGTGMGYLVGVRDARMRSPTLRTDVEHRVIARKTSGAGPLALFEIEIYGKDDDPLVSGQISAYALGEASAGPSAVASSQASRKQNH